MAPRWLRIRDDVPPTGARNRTGSGGSTPMRDIALTTVIFGLLPFVFARPWFGILLWTWVGLMNPHKLTFGFAYNLPFAEVIGIVTIISIVLSKEPKPLPLVPPVVLLLALNAWMVVTTFYALFPSDAWSQLEKVAKIQLFTFLTIMVMQSRDRIKALVWVSTLSIAYFGIKGGVYTIMKGGGGMVLGPNGGFIAGNTEISLALTMTLPLMRWLQLQTPRPALKWVLGICMALVFIAILGSYSRGGFLALFAMAAAFWLKGNRKFFVGVLLLALVPIFLAIMPEAWWDRMGTIQTFEYDSSATARINSWQFGWNMATDKPIVGGGLQAFQPDAFARWAPDPTRVWDSHSIWVSILAEHGFVGLTLFVVFWVCSWRLGSKIVRATRGLKDYRWAADLATMIQVSFIGYWVGGAFLSLAYWDFPYLLVAILVVTQAVVQKSLSQLPTDPRQVIAIPPLGLGKQIGQLSRTL
ncbi:MAG TPA: putative O-glycosylation ligase, exosortase A system-associated [Burkholderiales bacterium]|nr:putative O-glycosylation ligase, exosortase A system-associated [Burkholderiales bacterium]